MREETTRLLKQADRDIENGCRNIDIGAYEVAAFLAEQAVEKYLKGAFLEIKRTATPRTHYLMELGQQLGAPQPILRDLAYLTPDYTMSRYPDAANGIPYEIYDQELAEKKIATAKRVIEWLRTLMKR